MPVTRGWGNFMVRVGGVQTVLLIAIAAAASPAVASISSDQLCSGEALTQAASTSDHALLDAARRIEATLASDSAITAGPLLLPSTASETAGPAALAQYCSAAGELMRLSAQGSQRQAQTYLQTALANSIDADLPQLTALSAYRLGVVSVSGASVSGLRGGKPVRRNGGRTASRLRAAAAADDSSGAICSALQGFEAIDTADMSLSMLALDCATRLAAHAGNYGISALASLRFARFALDWVHSSDDPQALLDVARDRALAAIPVADRVPQPELRSELMARLARTILELDQRSASQLRAVPDLIRRNAQPGSSAERAALDLQGRLSLAEGDRNRARSLIEQAILAESARPVPLMLPELLLLLAEAEPGRRSDHVAAAYSALENIRPSLPRLDPLTEESMFSLHMRRVFEAAADAQLLDATGDNSGRRIRTAQQIIEAFREAELQSAVGSECLPTRASGDLADLQADELILYPLLFDDRVELIYAQGRSDDRPAEFRRLPPNRSVNRDEMAKLVDSLVVELTGSEGEGWKSPASRLYEVLIQPIEASLKPGSTLAIVPDGQLRGTPFAMLTAADGRFLVERTALSVAPALAYSQPGAQSADDKNRIVAASLAKRVNLPAGTFAALSGTVTEAMIAAASGEPGTLVPDFTREQLVTALSAGEVDILHLATHAAFNGRSDRAFIVADGEVIRLSELRDILAENRVRGELLDLLVLSACETAVGDEEASMGLAGAAVQAGALSAIASLWQVDDSGTAELMRQFYSNLRSGKTRSDALRQAQLSLIHSGGPHADPFIWSAFTLLGAWR